MEEESANNAWKLSDIQINWHTVAAGSISTVIIFAIAISAWYLLSKALRRIETRHVSQHILLPVRLTLKYGIFFAAIMLALSSFGIPIGNFWTFVSTLLGLIAIGFVAVWSVLSNISSTFFLLGFKPFKVGEYIKIVGDDISRRVVDLNFMFTTLRRENGDLFRIPNNQFFQKSTCKPSDNGKSDTNEIKPESSAEIANQTTHQGLGSMNHQSKR